MPKIEFIYYFSGIAFYVLLTGGFIWFIVSLFQVRSYERKINELHKELEAKIDNEKERLASLSIIEDRIKIIKEEYNPRIKELERNRRFILGKLPFIR